MQEYQKARPFDNLLETKVLYYDANGVIADPKRAVKKVTLDCDIDGKIIKTFTELSLKGFQ